MAERSSGGPWLRVLGTELRLLTFRATHAELAAMDGRHLLLGILCTWFVGIGRWWDHPTASLLQRSGIGSLLYVLALSVLLWLVILPLLPRDWSFRNVLTFVSLTSPPGLLYAIPVERMMDVERASVTNLWFLGVVATWRVSLLFFYAGRLAGLSIVNRVIVTLLPITGIILGLAMLGLQRPVFNVMGSMEHARTADDDVNMFLFLLSGLSFCGAIPLLIMYSLSVIEARQERKLGLR